MKLYMHPVSTTSRPIRLLIAEKKLPVQEQVVDLMKGEHHSPSYAELNPNRQVPMIEDGDFRLTESAAILRFLCGEFKLPEYPTDLRQRAKVDEKLDWFNTQFNRDVNYGMSYPQLFDHHKRQSQEAHDATIAWGKEKAKTWFTVLDTYWLAGGKPYLCGDQITIADYFGACMVTLGEVIRSQFDAYPNVVRWLGNVKKLSTWSQVNEHLGGFASAVKGKEFVSL